MRKKVEKIKCFCQTCNKEFFILPHRKRSNRGKYCSMKCKNIGYSKNFQKENNPNWKGGFMTKECIICHKSFVIPRNRPGRRFCSLECRKKGKIKIFRNFICSFCKKEFSNYRKKKYCSKECRDKTNLIIIHKKYKERVKQKFTCQICNKEYVSYEERKFCSRRCQMVYDNKKITKRCSICFTEYETYKSHMQKYCSEICSRKAQSLRQKGELSHLWKGGKTDFNAKIRNHPLYGEWRKSVFERDDYTCQSCFKTSAEIPNGELTAHHIIPFSEDIKFALKKSNGITLCWQCHKDFGKYVRSGILETKENNLKMRVKEFLDKEPNVYLFKIHGDAYQTIGIPDFLGVVSGRATAIELKVYPNFLTLIQRYTLIRLKKAGCATFVCRSLDEVKRAIDIIKEATEI